MDENLFEVRHIGLPLRVLVSSRQHHDELMREFALLALAREEVTSEDVPSRFTQLVELLGERYARANTEPDAAIEAAIARGDETIDLVYRVPAHVVDAADQLEALMVESDEFCRAEKLLTLERTEVEQQFARWYLEEFRRQIAGRPPTPWGDHASG